MHVGLVGTGNMGRPMAKNILKVGHQAKAAMGREAWTLYGQAREAGLGKLDTSGLLGLLGPKP